jgi:hypothetical protein
MQADMSWVHDTKSPRVKTTGDGVPEGIFYPQKDDESWRNPEKAAEWQTKAIAAGQAAWRAIGDRKVILGRRHGHATVHAFRTSPRGHGKRRIHYRNTTECGQFFEQPGYWALDPGVLSQATCLSCRSVVRERWELDQAMGSDADDLLAEYDAQRFEEWWQVQAEWHKPDPLPLIIPNWVGEGAYT